MSHLNIEIKARCHDLEQAKAILHASNARFAGLDHQVDTYFRISYGKLKLREGNIENNLIYYDRETKEGPKQSNVFLYRSPPDKCLKELLTAALGTLILVDKSREIYWIENVKFHLDNVLTLGTFLEIEAIDKTGDIGTHKLYEQCQQYMTTLNVQKEDLISQSYSDMLLKK